MSASGNYSKLVPLIKILKLSIFSLIKIIGSFEIFKRVFLNGEQ